MTFKLTRYFSLTSLIGIAVVLVVLFWFYRHFSFEQLIEHEARANAALTQAFANSIWDDYRGFVKSSAGMTREALLDTKEVRGLKAEVLKKMQGLNVVKVKIYNLDGLTVFSTDEKQIGEDKSRNAGFLGAKQGKILNQLTFRDRFDAFEETIVDRNVISSYIPLRTNADSSVEAVFEVYSDVTSLVRAQNRIQWIILTIVLSSLSLLYVFLYYIVGRANRIIEKQEHARQLNEEKIRYHAFYDSLTDLPNRTSFLERLEDGLKTAKRTGRPIGLMFIDLDRFKVVNDSLGHDAGDHLLRMTARRIRNCVRESDLVFRMGGDEFTVLLETLEQPEDAAYVARRVIEAMTKPIRIHGHDITIGASIGITIFPTDAASAQKLVKHADTAMYNAKELGRNRYVFFTKEMNVAAHERLELETALQKVVRENFNEFTLHYQPRICTQTGTAVAVEALLRWHHPKYGLVMPNSFIPILEETGLIVPVGEWVLRTACEQNKIWQEQGVDPVRMCVNISSRQFRSGDLGNVVERILHETGLLPKWLELEMTESLLVDNPEIALNILRDLKQIGVHLSIDDFGSGYSSLNYLKQFPIDYLKIDRTFVKDLDRDQKDAAIATAIANLAHTLNIQVVAEGVENQRQADFLKSRDCDEMQGFMFAKPLPADQVIDMLTLQGRSIAIA